MNVNRYAVEMRVSRGGKEPRIVTRIEHAYSVLDALQQAGVNHVAENPGEMPEGVVHIGPPMDALEVPPGVVLHPHDFAAAFGGVAGATELLASDPPEKPE
jgi:hypothetical protein